MQGTKREPGLVRLAAREIFSRISKTPERSFLIRVSYLEIYNEEIRDLLDGIFVESNEVSITSLDMIQRCLEEGEARRHIGETDMNKRSSRSHTIFRITIESRSSQELEKEFEEGKTEEESGYSALVATLNLVDLAGSESVRVTNAVIKDLSTGQTTSKGSLRRGLATAALTYGTSQRDKERLETDMEHRVGDKVAQVLEEEREKIKRQYETIIHEMRASLLVGGRVVEMRRSVEDGESASSVAHSLAHARLKRGKRGRSRKMRQTWCPGEMADPKQLLEEEETSFDFDAPGPAMSVGLPAVAE
ncbi:KIN7L, partial [Symbiodinium sp. KB8]